MGFEMLARPAIRKMRGFAEGTRPVQQAILTHGVKQRQDRRFFDRATVLRDPETGELLDRGQDAEFGAARHDAAGQLPAAY